MSSGSRTGFITRSAGTNVLFKGAVEIRLQPLFFPKIESRMNQTELEQESLRLLLRRVEAEERNSGIERLINILKTQIESLQRPTIIESLQRPTIRDTTVGEYRALKSAVKDCDSLLETLENNDRLPSWLYGLLHLLRYRLETTAWAVEIEVLHV